MIFFIAIAVVAAGAAAIHVQIKHEKNTYLYFSKTELFVKAFPIYCVVIFAGIATAYMMTQVFSGNT
jgi:uncharacterized protein (UPF0333 family)